MSTYSTRIFVKVKQKELMEQLAAMDISDLGRGFYEAAHIFNANSLESNFYDTESAINENDLRELVGRIVEIIAGQGTVLADTWSYDYDPFPLTCYYNGGKIITQMLAVDGGEFCETVDITDTDAWICAVEDTDKMDCWFDEEDEE